MDGQPRWHGMKGALRAEAALRGVPAGPRRMGPEQETAAEDEEEEEEEEENEDEKGPNYEKT
eukprot:1837658-Pyramimonas_sp.AAC.1